MFTKKNCKHKKKYVYFDAYWSKGHDVHNVKTPMTLCILQPRRSSTLRQRSMHSDGDRYYPTESSWVDNNKWGLHFEHHSNNCIPLIALEVETKFFLLRQNQHFFNFKLQFIIYIYFFFLLVFWNIFLFAYFLLIWIYFMVRSLIKICVADIDRCNASMCNTHYLHAASRTFIIHEFIVGVCIN